MLHGVQDDKRGRKPPWLKVSLPEAQAVRRVERLLRGKGLHTVCDSALCPNRGECFGQGTATFLILGNVCTRGCRFCAVPKGVPELPDPTEPERVAEAAAALELKHVVVTSVTRDDLQDGGASHFAATIRAVRRRLPGATVEVLTPDFAGSEQALDTVLAESPEVFNHNLETVPRLYGRVRPRADYRRSLRMLAHAAERGVSVVKTGCMVGLGEREEEVLSLLSEVASVGVSVVVVGQYLQPSRDQLAVESYVRPEQFDRYRSYGEELGLVVQAGPLARSSYHAAEAVGLAAAGLLSERPVYSGRAPECRAL